MRCSNVSHFINQSLIFDVFFNLIKLLSQNSIEKCPVLQPSEQEFRNFSQYTDKIYKIYSKSYGMVKVVPPNSWKPRQSPYQQSLRDLIINNPIEQNPEGKAGIFQFKHIPIQSISYREYIKKYSTRENDLKQKSSDDIQSLFWKSLPYSPPVYGADLMGSLMENCAGQWNLNSLDTLLSHGIQKNIRGVNKSYCYIGSWKALFCWHKQDLDLQAINYLHLGKSKFWYCIQTDDSHILQSECKKHFFKGFDGCPQYLRHKTCLINPYILKKSNPKLKICKIQQKPGEFVIGFSGAYHCGFNFGVNVAQAVNFGTLSWLMKLKDVKYCKCKKSSVKMNYQAVLDRLLSNEYYKNNDMIITLKNDFQKEINTELQSYKGTTFEENDFNQEEGGVRKKKKVNKTKKIEKQKKDGLQKKNNKHKRMMQGEKISQLIEQEEIIQNKWFGQGQDIAAQLGIFQEKKQNLQNNEDIWMNSLGQQQPPMDNQ